jgi:F-type H+-transporting ATPase subunit b
MHNILSLFNVIAEESAKEGFGINTDIFDTNIINIALLWAIILYAGSDFLSSTLSDRQQKNRDSFTRGRRTITLFKGTFS